MTPGSRRDKKVCSGPSVAHFCPIGRKDQKDRGKDTRIRLNEDEGGPRFREIMEFLSFFCYFFYFFFPFYRCSMAFRFRLGLTSVRFRLTRVCFLSFGEVFP